jgi:hypothetical protein
MQYCKGVLRAVLASALEVFGAHCVWLGCAEELLHGIVRSCNPPGCPLLSPFPRLKLLLLYPTHYHLAPVYFAAGSFPAPGASVAAYALVKWYTY